MINIFNYLDPAEYLKDSHKELKTLKPSFSIRAWARQLGMKSHAPLHDVLNKRRMVPKKLIPKLCKSLQLEGRHKDYFEALVEFQRSKSYEEKEFYKQKLDKLSPSKQREISDLEAYKYITDPHHIIISELTQLKHFQPTAGWVKQHLRFSKNLKEIEDIYNRLKKLEIIEEKNNKVIKTTEHIYTKDEIKSEAIQQYHKICADLAKEQISKQDLSEREFNSIAFNIKKESLPKIKEAMREFVNRLIDEHEAKAHQGDETYQLNMHLFSLSK